MEIESRKTYDVRESVRIESKFKNGRLYDALIEAARLRDIGSRREDLSPIKPLCDAFGLNYTKVNALLCMRETPLRRDGTPIKTAQQIMDLVAMGVEDLFPPELYAKKWPRNFAVYVDPLKMTSLIDLPASKLMLPASQYEDVEAEEIRNLVKKSLETLSPRDAKVIEMRFGLGEDGIEHDLASVGRSIGVSRERARQLEMRALRRLRHPKRARSLRPYLKFRYPMPDSQK